MMKKEIKKELALTLIIVTGIGIGVLARALPHVPNFSVIGALALFGGAFFVSRFWGVLIPLAALLLTDLGFELFSPGTGFYPGQVFVYISFLLIGLIGFTLRNNKKPLNVGLAAIGGSLTFFLVSNLGVWFSSGMYALTVDGLINCYLMAIPFFKTTLLSDLVFSGVLFGGTWLISLGLPSLNLVENR